MSCISKNSAAKAPVMYPMQSPRCDLSNAKKNSLMSKWERLLKLENAEKSTLRLRCSVKFYVLCVFGLNASICAFFLVQPGLLVCPRQCSLLAPPSRPHRQDLPVVERATSCTLDLPSTSWTKTISIFYTLYKSNTYVYCGCIYVLLAPTKDSIQLVPEESRGTFSRQSFKKKSSCCPTFLMPLTPKLGRSFPCPSYPSCSRTRQRSDFVPETTATMPTWVGGYLVRAQAPAKIKGKVEADKQLTETIRVKILQRKANL